MAATKFERLQRRLGDAATGKDELLLELLEGAEQSVKSYCRRSTLPPEADTLIVKIAVIDYNRIGAEGMQGQNISGVSESWADGYPADIRGELLQYRRARFV